MTTPTSVRRRSVIKGNRPFNVAETQIHICKQSETSCVRCSRSAVLHTLHFVFGTSTQHDELPKVFFPGIQMFAATCWGILFPLFHPDGVLLAQGKRERFSGREVFVFLLWPALLRLADSPGIWARPD